MAEEKKNELKVELIDLSSDWLEEDRERRIAKTRAAIRAKHRRRHLREIKQRQTQEP